MRRFVSVMLVLGIAIASFGLMPSRVNAQAAALDVAIAGKTVFRIRTGAGGFTAVERMRLIEKRLQVLIGTGEQLPDIEAARVAKWLDPNLKNKDLSGLSITKLLKTTPYDVNMVIGVIKWFRAGPPTVEELALKIANVYYVSETESGEYVYGEKAGVFIPIVTVTRADAAANNTTVDLLTYQWEKNLFEALWALHTKLNPDWDK